MKPETEYEKNAEKEGKKKKATIKKGQSYNEWLLPTNIKLLVNKTGCYIKTRE